MIMKIRPENGMMDLSNLMDYHQILEGVSGWEYQAQYSKENNKVENIHLKNIL
ncbi:MAG: hypothetical protein CM15mV120_380 [uncultured marine virus]|nr:MAG: hypothetical protein CM15mV120_380 [uncultured marine virus]